MCLNSEFALHRLGRAPLAGKTYTFRPTGAGVHLSGDGVDLAVLANNHVFDFGEAGLQDTPDTFRRRRPAPWGES